MSGDASLSGTGQKNDLIGVCAAIGHDFGFNPDILRVALAVGLLFAPMAVFGGYAAMGVVVLASRLLVPARPRRRAPAPASAATIPPAPIMDREPVRMLEAA